MAIIPGKDKTGLTNPSIRERDTDKLVTRPIQRDDSELAINGYQPIRSSGTDATQPPPKKP